MAAYLLGHDLEGCRPVRPNQLGVSLFSGNYTYQRDGVNNALTRLVGYLERQGVAVRVYSP
ncbi:MAG: hypothetical protein H7243_07745, partial [Sphingomonadaceae bacterium]|nr:hypothetical protein [Sphingomonadaceae bacterium]